MAYPFDDEPKKDNLALADISMFKSEPLSQSETEPLKLALADLNMVSKEAAPVEKKPTAFDLGVTFNPAAATAPVPKEFEGRMDLARIKEFRQDQQSQEAPDRGPLGELAVSLGRGAANILMESPLVLGQWGAKALGAEETAKSLDPYIESVKAIQETQALRPGKKAEAVPEIELNKTFSDPRAVLGQIKENVSNPYFWLSKVPEAGMSWLPIIGATTWVRWVGQAEKLVAGIEAAQAIGATAKAAEFASKLARVSKLAETAGYATGMAMEAADQAGRLRDWEQKTGKQVDWATQVGTVLGAGALAGALEKVGLDKVTKLFEGKRGAATVMKVLDTVAWEGATEGAQEVIQNAAEKYGYNFDKKLTEGVVEAVLIGAALGGAGGTIAKARSTWNQLLSGAKSEQGDTTAAPVTTTRTDNLQPTAEAGADITAPATQATPVEKTSGENTPLPPTSEGLENFINAPVPEQPGGTAPPVETGATPAPPPAPKQDLDPEKFTRDWLAKQTSGPSSMTSLILEYAEAKGLANLDASHEILPILEAMEKTGDLGLKDVAREDGEWGDTMLTFTPLGSATTAEKGEAAEAPKREPVSVGKTAEVVTSQGTKADTQYQVFNIKDLIASHDSGLSVTAAYLKELQPRDRKRAETELLVGRIASAPDPEQLAENRMASDGAPIIGPDMMVEAGNGRVIGMQRAYEQGTAQAYRQWLVDNADRFGLDPQAIAAVEQPLMVRMRTTEVDRTKFARESNMASVTAMSPAERAKADAQALMDNKLLDFFHPDEDNRIDTKDNKNFVRAFLGRVVGKTELNSLLDSKGDISKAGLDRIRAAVLSAAYGETGVIEKLLEDTNDQTKNISHALMKTAPHVAKIRYQIQKGELHDRSMDNELAEAMRILQKTRETRGNLADSIRRIEFMDEVDPLVKELLNVFQAHGRARNRIAAVITNYYNIVEALGNPKQGELFGPAEIIGKPEILAKAIEMMEAEYAQETEQVPDEVPEAESRGDEAAGQDIGRTPEEKAGAEQGESGVVRESGAKYKALNYSKSADPTYAPIFYSQLLSVIEEKLPNRGSGEQLAATLESWAQKGQTKADELKWSGLVVWLRDQKGPVTKQQVLDKLQEDRIEIKEVEREEGGTGKQEWWYVAYRNGSTVGGGFLTKEAAEADLKDLFPGREGDFEVVRKTRDIETEPQFKNYMELPPGGKNYREVLLTLPEKKGRTIEKQSDGLWRVVDKDGSVVASNLGFKAAQQAVGQALGKDRYHAPTGHRYNHPAADINRFAHVFMDDRVIGGKKYLTIWEMQSDWSQEGRKKGFKEGIPQENFVTWGARHGISEKEAKKIFQTNDPRFVEYRRIQDAALKDSMKVPPFPFAKNWHEVALKRVLRYAAEGNYDGVAWATGQTIKSRYDLSKKVDNLLFRKNEDGTYYIEAEKGGESLFRQDAVPGDKLDGIVGKDIAQKIIQQEGGGVLSGPDLKMGGEWANRQYDQMMPQFLKKYGKQWGATVGQGEIREGGLFIAEEAPGDPTNDIFYVLDRDDPKGPPVDVFHSPKEAQAFIDSLAPHGAWVVDTPDGGQQRFETQEIAQEWANDAAPRWGVPPESMRPYNEGYKAETIHTVSITPAMRESLLFTSQALFESAHQLDLSGKSEGDVAFGNKRAEAKAIEKAAQNVEAANQGGKSNVQESIETWRSEVAKVYHQQKYVNLTGYQIKGPEDLADLMQIYRTPKKEILHVVYADADGNILAHNAMTSGALSFVSVGDMTKFMYRVQKTAKKFGAAKVHVMHNHPSGDPSMSLYDKKFADTLKNGSQLRTKITGLGDMMGDFLVIDHGTFTHFNYETGKEVQGSYQVRRADGSKADNWLDERMTADAKTLAMMTQHLNLSADQVALVYLDLNNNINGWSVHRANIMEKERGSLYNVLSQQAKAHDGSSVAILFGSKGDYVDWTGKVVKEGWQLGGWVSTVMSPSRDFLNNTNPEVFEEAPKADKNKTVAMPPQAPFASNRDDIDAYKENKVADTRSPKTTGAKRAKEWIVKQFNAFYEKWIDAFVAIEDLSDWVELQAKLDQNTRIPGRHVAIPTGQVPKYSLDAVRGKAAGWVEQAIKGEGVFWDDMVEGVETLKVQELALQARQEFIDKGKVSADTKEKLDKELARKFFSGGPPKKVGNSLVETLKPLNDLAKQRGFERDQVYSDLFDALMIAERDIELAARGNIKGVDEARSRQVIDALKAEYGDDYKVLEDTAGAVRDWIDMAILQPLVRVGRLSQQTYDLIKASNQFYVPYFRLIEEMSEREHVPSTVNIMEVRNVPVKEIKGSERQILPPLDMILYLTYNVANIYARAKTAKTLMDLPLFMDETGITIEAPKFHPQEVQLRQAVDKQLREGLTKVANSLGVTVDYTTRHRKLGRRTLGAYLKATGASQNATDQIMMLFGATEKTLSHELGHVVDDKFDLQGLLLKDPVTRKEVRLIADQRAGATPNKAYHKYVRSRPEQVAEFVCRYLTAKDLCRAVAPQATAKLEKLFGLVPELQPLLTLMPGFETGTMTIEDQVWVRSPFPPKDNCMLVYDNGLPKWVKLPPDVYRACMAMTPAEVDAVVKLLAAPANWLRAGAVLNPEFSARNIPRDLMVAKLFSKHGFKVNQWLVDAYNLATGDEATQKLYHQFAAGSGVFADQPHSMQDVAKITADDLKGVKKPYIVYANPIKAYQIILHYLRETSGASENVTRFSLYRQALDNGASHVEAIHEARRTTLDFNRHGASQAARMMGMIIPFFNPSLQGVDKVFHELVSPKNPRRGAAWFRVMTHITLPSIVLWLLFHRDKRIQELEDYEKNYFWHVPLGSDGPILRIPKPFEVGILFGSMPQRIFDAAVDKDADGIKSALGAALDALTPSPMPTLMRLFVESRSNYNFFTERRIEDQAQQQLPPELRGKPWTMELSKAFSKHIGKHLDISPAMFEHWVRTLGGGLWANYMLPTADLVLRKTGVLEDITKPKGDLLNEIPGIRAFFSRMPTGHRAKSVNDFFERYGAVIQADQGWKKLWKDGDIKAANEFLKDHPEAIFAKVAHRTMKEMGDIRSERTKIYQSKTLSPESKRKALDRLDDRMMTLARSAGTYMNPEIAKSVALPATRTIDGAMDIKQYYERISIPTFEKYQEMRGKLPKLADMPDADKRDKLLLGEIKQEMLDFKSLLKKPESARTPRPDSIYDKPTRKERAEWQQTYGPGARVKKGQATGFRLKPEKETE